MVEKHPLANVLRPPDAPRGPNVRSKIRVPRAWLREGAQIVVPVPRQVACAACEGGGCEACSLRGGFAFATPETPSVDVSLPRGADGPVVLRLANQGVTGGGAVAGDWLLEVHAGDAPSAGVMRAGTRAQGWPRIAWGPLVFACVVLALGWVLARL